MVGFSLDTQINGEKHTKNSKWNILFWIGILAFIPLVIFLTEISQKYFPQGGLWGEFVIAILIPALIVYVIFRMRKR